MAMMNNKTRLAFLTLLLSSIIPFRISAQSATTYVSMTSLRAIYRLDYRLDSAVTTPKSEQMILRINNGISSFRSQSEYIHDSVYASLNQLPQNERTKAANDAARKVGKTVLFYSILKEPAKDLVFYHDNIASIDHQYQDKAPLFHWKIMPTKQVVAGYECQQAFTTFGGRTWEAWFTRDIPVSDGPYKFYGLPGLIIKVRDTHNNYIFEILSIDNRAKPFTLSATTSAPLIKKEKFKLAKLNDELTFLDRMTGNGNNIPESARANYLEKLKRRNNPLELK